ncbi:MAG: carbamoyltransferase HypF [Frankiaceae bacterium]
MNEQVRVQVRVKGVVQGVGFRPFAYALATQLGLAGLVSNDSDGVLAEVEGASAAVATFVRRLREDAPPLAVVESVVERPLTITGRRGFTIAPSHTGSGRRTLVSPDMATCADCLRELFDPADRRYRYPFTNCTNCGPRFTIVRDVPYDRPATTMAGFTMCPECAREYSDPADRRFHAQPVCCPSCGPTLRILDAAGTVLAGGAADGGQTGSSDRQRAGDADPIVTAARLLAAGAVVAVKGLGGYHLAALASSEPAVAALRARKHREDKPFALMVPDLAAAARLCRVPAAAEAALCRPERPILLLERLDTPGRAGEEQAGGQVANEPAGGQVAPSVAPGNRHLGLMLPYTPLHHLLAAELAAPFVLTSGNVSDEPIAYDDADALRRLCAIADAFLVHDRAIHMRTDDSVLRMLRGAPTVIRRSRGFVPRPLLLPAALPRPVLACGAELKNTFCLGREQHAFVSHHIGDLENAETLKSFTDGIVHFRRLFDVEPQVVAYDLHPEYLSTKYALDLAAETGLDAVGVQHHHAHIAACLADNGALGPVIGVAFDGLGYGEDGTLWGGEFLIADLAAYRRVGSLEQVRLPGGTAAIRQPWRMAAAYLVAAFGSPLPTDLEGLEVAHRNAAWWPAVCRMAETGLQAPLTSSAGRLFDAVAALAGVRDTAHYEGQAAIELEQRAAAAWDDAECVAAPVYVAGIDRPDGDGLFRVRGTDLVRSAVRDVTAGVDSATVATRFHAGVADLVVRGCEQARRTIGLSHVALSGGVFQNVLLTELAVRLLEKAGFTVLTHRRVPPNDGGISLGQVAVAGARAAR